MDDQVLIASTVHGTFTGVRGRYLLSGDGFKVASDSSPRSGGRGEEASALDLLVASLVSCALNAFRRDLLDEASPDRRVEIMARVERELTSRDLGHVILECVIEGPEGDFASPEELVDEYRRRCRIYGALQHRLPISFVTHPAGSALAESVGDCRR